MNIYVGLPVWRDLHSACAMSLLAFQRHAMMNGHVVGFNLQQGDALIGRARSRLATQFLTSPFDVMLSIDSDIHFEAAPALRMCIKAVEMQTIIGGLYVTRAAPHQPSSTLPDERVVTLGESVVECDQLAAGFMAVSKGALERVQAFHKLPMVEQDSAFPFRPFFNSRWDEHGSYESEDWAFSRMAKDAGVQPYLTAVPNLTHFGDKGYTVQDMAPPGRQPTVALKRNGQRVFSISPAVAEGVSRQA